MIPGTLVADLEVVLHNDSPSLVSIPDDVTNPAGAREVKFAIPGSENQARDGSHIVTIAASTATFTSASDAVTLRDNEPASYRFLPLPELVDATVPVSVMIKGIDIEGNEISRVSGSVGLSIVLPDRSMLPASPDQVTAARAAGWTAAMDLHLLQTRSLRLQASGDLDAVGESNEFSLMRALDLRAGDLLWDENRSRINASLPYATLKSNPADPVVVRHKVVAFNPATLEITAEAVVGAEPGKLALTSGGEFLYVALDRDGAVSKIKLPEFIVEKTFQVGTDPGSIRLHAKDLCTVSGQPDLLVISQSRKAAYSLHAGVAVYKKGFFTGFS